MPRIESHYDNLVGLSIGRGFTHKVRELFGGPRGCTHTTALLQAMAPVAVQCFWSITASEAKKRVRSADNVNFVARVMTPEEREAQWKMNLNTCHVWAEDGEMMATARAGGQMEMMLQVKQRFTDLGIPEEEWGARM